MGGEEVAELSVDDTNALRAKLGLKPLRISGRGSVGGQGGARTSGADAPAPAASGSQTGGGEDELSLSVDDSNALRARLGLAPLRTGPSGSGGRKPSEAVHAPAANIGDEKAARARVEDAKARRAVEAGIGRLASRAGLKNDQGDEEGDGVGDGVGDGAADWAARMRSGKGTATSSATEEGKTQKKKKKSKKSKKKRAGGTRQVDVNRISVPIDDDEAEQYGSSDLAGLAVGHSAEEFEAGQTTVLTLADTSLLGWDDAEGGPTLENANMRDDGVSRDNLKLKRQVEMGMGHAGGYAGYDDDEFGELGGSQAAGRISANGAVAADSNKSRDVGFRIGEGGIAGISKSKANEGSDLFVSGDRAISLQTGTASQQSDFMTHEEADAADDAAIKEREKREKEARKREKKLFKKIKKDKRKKDKKEHRRDSEKSDDDAEVNGGSILDDLEATAHSTVRDGKAKSHGSRRRRMRENGNGGDAMDIDGPNGDTAMQGEEEDEQYTMRKKRQKFDEVMEKGNKRTSDAHAFGATASEEATKGPNFATEAEEDDGEDDAFLNAALAKARRLHKLKELQASQSSVASSVKHADAVIEAVRQNKIAGNEVGSDTGNASTAKGSARGGVTFEFDETREFTRALRAREDQAARGVKASAKNPGGVKIVQSSARDKQKKLTADAGGDGTDTIGVDIAGKDGEVADMQELAKQMSDDEEEDAAGGFGLTANSAPVGRGLANVLSMLKQTGDFKNAGREELRGRAKDERTYDDYEALNLKDVVKIDESAMTNDKDREFANREIKLEYRDEHGRLLTRKEAYRQMCYQFHGHGSSKKNEERRLKQIAREQAEAAAASRHQGGKGTLGALKATQEATGQAFVVHKTG